MSWKQGFHTVTPTQHLPETSGLFNHSAKVCLCVFSWWDGSGGIVLQDVQTHSSNMHACKASPHGKVISFSWMAPSHLRQASSRMCCGVLAQRKPFVWVLKQRGVYLGLVGLTVSPVKATLQLSAFEQMGTNLHLINRTSLPCFQEKFYFFSSSSFLKSVLV